MDTFFQNCRFHYIILRSPQAVLKIVRPHCPWWRRTTLEGQGSKMPLSSASGSFGIWPWGKYHGHEMHTLRPRVQLQLLNQSSLVSTPTAYYRLIDVLQNVSVWPHWRSGLHINDPIRVWGPQLAALQSWFVQADHWSHLSSRRLLPACTLTHLDSNLACGLQWYLYILDLGRLICSVIVIANLKSWRIFPTLHLWFPMR